MHSVSVNVEPDQYLAGWRAEHGALFIPALSEARVGEHAAVRVGIYGQSIRATVYTYAFILIASFIPLVGLFAVLGGAVLLGIGLSRMHRTDLWRGIVAVFTPLVLCCGTYLAFIAFALAAGNLK